MTDRYMWVEECKKCGESNDVYYMDEAFESFKCTKCGAEHKLSLGFTSELIENEDDENN